jgi:thioredoxin reductase (NADPH)
MRRFPRRRPGKNGRVPEIVDAVVIGGGPAGLSAALNLARYDRTVSLFDAGGGRSSHAQVNRNYLGFPGGIAAAELRRLGREQLAEYDQVRCFDERVSAISRADGAFVVDTDAGEARGGRTVVLCTGVEDRFPKDAEPFVGRGVYWCITCDGYEARGKDVVVIGDSDGAAVEAMQLWRLTSSVTMLTNHDGGRIRGEMRSRLERAAIAIVEDRIAGFVGAPGSIEGVRMASGGELAAQAVFVVQGAAPRTTLARSIGVELAETGWIAVDAEQRTSIEGVFAAGDVTSLHSHQVATAVHEGNQAAAAANQLLYPEELRAP